MTKEYMAGRNWGFKYGRFENKNPYRPGTIWFEDWAAGFKKGSQEREWL